MISEFKNNIEYYIFTKDNIINIIETIGNLNRSIEIEFYYCNGWKNTVEHNEQTKINIDEIKYILDRNKISEIIISGKDHNKNYLYLRIVENGSSYYSLKGEKNRINIIKTELDKILYSIKKQIKIWYYLTPITILLIIFIRFLTYYILNNKFSSYSDYFLSTFSVNFLFYILFTAIAYYISKSRPKIEFDFGPDHEKHYKIKRKKLIKFIMGFIGIIISLIVSFISYKIWG